MMATTNESHVHSVTDNDIRPHFVQLASTEHQQLWEHLTPQQQVLLENQATLRTLDTPEKVNRFFESRSTSTPQTSPFVVAKSSTKEILNETINDPIVSAMHRLF